jgi:DNA-binding MarR family transcriptional regulator
MESTEKTVRDGQDLYRKWGKAILSKGWTSTPNLLLKHAGKMGLDPTETLALIHLVRFWWKPENLPFPSITKTSEEMGVTRKTLSKKFASLKEKGLIQEVKGANGVTKYSLDGLIQKLKELNELEYLE